MSIALITGITGQDGAYLAKFLLTKQYTVIGITRSYNMLNLQNLEYLGIHKEVHLEECDLTDITSIIKILKKFKPNEIYNLSAQSSVGMSFEQPIGTIQFNIVSVLNILESIRILDFPVKLYQASSSEMYGYVEKLPITLDTPMHPLSPYAISKASAFWTTVSYRESYGLYVTNGVLFNHESFLRGQGFFVKKVIRGAISISKGTQEILRVGNIDIKRDFGYAPAYTEAMWLSLQLKESADYIICSGKSISLREIIYYVFNKLNIDTNLVVEDASFFRPNEIQDIYGDNSKSKNLLGWKYDLHFKEVLDKLIEEELNNWRE